MNIFTDFHHEGLLYSLVRLLEYKLGHNLYRPIGMEWYEQDFWMVHPARDTAEQYLSLQTGYKPKDGTHPLNEIYTIESNCQDEIFYVWDKYNKFDYKAITLETFKKMQIDIVICSIPQHIERFKRLIAMYKPEAKLIYQIGNAWNVEGDVKNIMASALVEAPSNTNLVVYHQEFDTKIFDYKAPKPTNNIYSFMNVAQNFEDWNMFLALENMMKRWNLRAYGGQCRDGNMEGYQALSDKMSEARFIWHVKAGGDGYGHIIHNAAAVGRPAIVKKSYYRGKLAEALMIDGVTCIDIDNLNPGQIIQKIEYYNEPERYNAMSKATYENFRRNVDFDCDAEAIKTFLNKVVSN